MFYNCWLKVKRDSIMQKNNKDQMSTKHGMNVTLGSLAAFYSMADRVSNQHSLKLVTFDTKDGHSV